MKPLSGLILAIFLIAISGCGGNGNQSMSQTDLKLYPVTGRVLSGKQPVAAAKIEFKPKFEWQKEIAFPHATTSADGTYELETLTSADGAPAGDYNVSVSLADSQNQTGSGAYSDAAKSGLTATVKSSPTKVPDFILKSGIVKPSSKSARRSD